MKNGKWFAMLAACGLALGIAACGDEDGECPDDAMCLPAEGACQAHCDLGTPPTCTIDDDCADDEICDPACGGCIVTCTAGAACEGDTDCDQNACEICAAGECVSMCDELEVCDGAGNCVTAGCTDDTFDVCYDENAWCDTDAQGENGTCVPLDVGTCAGAAGRGTPDANGPMIYYVEQAGDCVQDDQTHCGGGYGCPFYVFFWDPNGDVDAQYSDVKYITSGGTVGPIGFTENAVIEGKFGAVTAWTCVGSDPEAVMILDNAGNESNAYCF